MYTLNKDGSVSENVPQVVDIKGIISEKDTLDQNIKALQDDLTRQTADRDALIKKLSDIAVVAPLPEITAALTATVAPTVV